MVLKRMSVTRIFSAASCVFFLAACGGGTPEAEVPESAAESVTPSDSEEKTESEESEESTASGPLSIPMTCHDGEDPCTPSPKWVKKLCADVYPAVALYLFQKESPFTRGYISARKVKAVNASGGATSGEEWLVFDEEVVFLHYREANTGGIQVSGGGGGYDAMRLDGSCVTLGSDEVRTHRPSKPKYTKVPWRYIGDDMEDALRDVPSIRSAYIERRQECKGAFSGTVTDKCIKKDEALNRAIIDALQSGEAKLPVPSLRP